jgi:hypothetical protein
MTDLDITGKIGDLFPAQSPEWPMYSYSRPAGILWNSIADTLHKNGWTEEQIQVWLKSRDTRWALDGELGDKIKQLGHDYAISLIIDLDK